MPKATAVWLVDNTTLTFDQISAFCGMHPLEVQTIADKELSVGMRGMNPILNGELTQAEIDRCAADPAQRLVRAKPGVSMPKAKKKGARYTPVSKRQDRPDAIAWVLKNYPEVSDAQVSKLIGTTKLTINSIRTKSHWNMAQIKPRNPISLGLCTAETFEKMLNVARARAGIVHGKAAAQKAPDGEAAPADEAAASQAVTPADDKILS